MSTLRVSNIEAKADVSSPTVDEKIKFTNSSGDVLFHLDGKTSGITTVGINTTGNTFTVNNTTGDISFSGSVTSSGVSTYSNGLNVTSGNVGIGTDNPQEKLQVQGDVRLVDNSPRIGFHDANATTNIQCTGGIELFDRDGNRGAYMGATEGSNFLSFGISPSAGANPTEKLRITSSGNIGIGTDNPARVLHTSGNLVRFDNNASAGIILVDHQNSKNFRVVTNTVNSHSFSIEDMGSSVSGAGTARLLIDSSGRLLVGTTSTSSNNLLVVAGTTNGNPGFIHLQTKSTTPGSTDQIGGFNFGTANDIAAARISATRDGGTWTAGSSTPTAIAFGITADSATAQKEKLRLKSDGVLASTNFETFLQLHGAADASTPSSSSTYNCVAIRGGQGQIQVSAQNTIAFDINRKFSDGTLVNFRGDGTIEGTIQISGTTISLSGAHLTRWSQLPGGVERTEILRGTVLSNIDEMCDWGEEENEQLNRMKVSDVEGDKNVSGVFQAWDDDDDTYTNDFYCAMTGDFVIRIGAGVTVARGDLLMSAGDGTAKPQDDDIIRSKTIAKVTSTHVSETYADGSYCVPCVLMAC